ncbi:MAG: hypothetical protein BWY42_01290 [Candidatus Omnitrophica bacterium ADurb.Bin277]|nr:MAG: hypothetical protein BWY42_01290 [Candidatus Omnitrophica bacterium ADurb.Bin277]
MFLIIQNRDSFISAHGIAIIDKLDIIVSVTILENAAEPAFGETLIPYKIIGIARAVRHRVNAGVVRNTVNDRTVVKIQLPDRKKLAAFFIHRQRVFPIQAFITIRGTK